MLLFEDYPWVIDFFIIYLGFVLGSFATALAYRLPRQRDYILEEIGEEKKSYNQSFWQGLTTRSRCPYCETPLGWRDLIPVISYIMSAGTCRHCAKPISIRYPITEVVTALLMWLIYFNLGFSFLGLSLMILLPFMMASSLIDLEFLILPDDFTILLGVFGVANLVHQQFFSGFVLDPVHGFLMTLLCAVVYGGIGWALQFGFERITGKEGLGWGDIKIFAVAGLWLGWFMMPIFLLLSSVIGLIVGLTWKHIQKSALFPFGPALILALYVMLIYNTFFERLL